MATLLTFTSFVSTAHAQATPAQAETATTPAPSASPSPASNGASPSANATNATSATSATNATSSTNAATTTELPAEGSHRTAWPWIIIGTGIALVVTATVFQIKSVSEDDKRDKAEQQLFPLQPGDPQRAALQASVKSHDDSAKSDRTTALIIGSIGFIAIAGSVVLWFYEGGSSSSSTTPAASAKKKAPAAKASLLPSFAPSYAGASFGMTF
jgi:hypothetical protein